MEGSFIKVPDTTGPFSSYEEAYDFIKSFSIANGFILVSKRSRKDQNNNLKSVEFICDRGGIYNNKNKTWGLEEY